MATQTRAPVDSALLLSLKFIIPLLFFTALIIAGTVSISYTFYRHQQLPQHFALGISLTFGLLIILTSALLLLRIRRHNQRRAIIEADREANRPRRTVREGGTRPRTRSHPPKRGNAKRVRSQGFEVEPGLELQGVPAPSSGERQPRSSPHRSISNPTSSSYDANTIQEPEPAHVSPPPTFLPWYSPLTQHPTNSSRRTTQIKVQRIHSPPPTTDHPAFHLPPLPSPLAVFPAAEKGPEDDTKGWWEVRKS